MKSFPNPLTPPEEKYYIQKYTEGSLEEGSLEAKHILIERNLRLVAHVMKKYQNLDEDPEDLLSIGTIGLIKAVTTFNPGKGNRLAAYASRCIENAILSPMRFYSRRKSPSKDRSHTGGYLRSFPMKTISCAEQKTALYGTPLCVSIHSG